ncbi:OmpA family protein [Vibrio owensii]|uniref:OmpA family protein n=1 Tax=Vibrio owensii TaxID=696485 RepID=A0AAP9G908_9VIBR|nr:OmpA family protein [Vibrio owensii]AYO12980.1 OmpA family protein [Vibrio owensii]QGH45659.1 OmpA family protein [Vibrio owensii]
MNKLILALAVSLSMPSFAQDNTNQALYYYCQQGQNQYQESMSLGHQTEVKYHQGPFMQIIVNGEQSALEPMLLSQLEQAGIDKSCATYLLSRAQLTEQKQGELAARVLFEFDKASLNAQSKFILTQLNQQLKQRPQSSLLVVGNTDAKGSNGYNLTLGLKRANSVAKYLEGYDEVVSTSRSDGETHPVSSNANTHGRELNRRVDINVPTQG